MKTKPAVPFVSQSNYQAPYTPLTYHPTPHLRRRHRRAVAAFYEIASNEGYLGVFKETHVWAYNNLYDTGTFSSRWPERRGLAFTSAFFGRLAEYRYTAYAGVLLRLVFDAEAKRWAKCVKASPDTVGYHATAKDVETGNVAFVDPSNPARPASLADTPIIDFNILRVFCTNEYGVRRDPFQPKARRVTRTSRGTLYEYRRFGGGQVRRINLSSPCSPLVDYTGRSVYQTTLIAVAAGVWRNTLGDAAMMTGLCAGLQESDWWVYPAGEQSSVILKHLWLLRQTQYYFEKFIMAARFVPPSIVSHLRHCLPEPRPLWVHSPKDHDRSLPMTKYSYLRTPYDGIVLGRFSVAPLPSLLSSIRDHGFSLAAGVIATLEAWAKPVSFTLNLLNNDDEQWVGEAGKLQAEWVRLYNSASENRDPSGGVPQEVWPFRSCMRNNAAPAAYGLPGNHLGLAYVTDAAGLIVGRSVLNLKTKNYIRLFRRNDAPLDQLLQAQGWGNDNDLTGFVLAALPTGRGEQYLMPYLDCTPSRVTLNDDGEGFVIGDYGIEATNTDGTIDAASDYPEVEDVTQCDCCGDLAPSESVQYSDHDDRQYCDDCISNGDVQWARGRRNNTVLTSNTDDLIYCESDGEWYTEDGADGHELRQCSQSGNWYSDDDVVMVTTSSGDEECVYTGHHRLRELAYDDDNGHNHGIRGDGAVQLHDGDWCHEGNAVRCFVSEQWYHDEDTDNIFKLCTVGRKAYWVSREALLNNPEEFVLCGTEDRGYALLPALYYGHSFAELAATLPADAEISITNAGHGNPDDTVTDILNELQGATA